jgi:predicted Zn-dependent protease with MMP-like domain
MSSPTPRETPNLKVKAPNFWWLGEESGSGSLMSEPNLEFPPDVVEDFFERFDALLEADAALALSHLDAAPSDIRELDEWVLCRGDALAKVHDAQQAVEWFESVIADYPGFADAHYRLAEWYEQLDRGAEAVRHHLETLRLDRDADGLSGDLEPETLERIASTAAETLATLPLPFRGRLGNVPVFLEDRPSEALVATGFDSRSLGLFSGPTYGELGESQLGGQPPEITLFVRCLFDAFGLDETELFEQVRVTILHEIGHFFGLDEDRLAELGLD